MLDEEQIREMRHSVTVAIEHAKQRIRECLEKESWAELEIHAHAMIRLQAKDRMYARVLEEDRFKR